MRDGRPLVYLDSGATSQKPSQVLDAERAFYEQAQRGRPPRRAPARRGGHRRATRAPGPPSPRSSARPADEVVFTKNATESLNLVGLRVLQRRCAGRPRTRASTCGPGDEILVTEMEHHANLVPWQELARRTGATLRWVGGHRRGPARPLGPRARCCTERTKVFAFAHVSNVLGTVNPVRALVAAARAVGALTVLDACQSVPHLPLDVQALGVDFAAFSGHKMFGPTGVGVLWGRGELLAQMPPFITGGSMIETVRMEGTHVCRAAAALRGRVAQRRAGRRPRCGRRVPRGAGHGPRRRPRARADGGGCSPAWLSARGSARRTRRRRGPRSARSPSSSTSVHAHDVGQVLDDQGIAVRVGHHCAWPLHRRFRATATTRASFAAYNTPGRGRRRCWTALDRVPAVFGVAS